MHPGEQLLVEAVDVADGLLQDLGLKQSSQWRLDRLNPFIGGGGVSGVTDPSRRRPCRGGTVNGNRLYCFTAAARIPSNFRSRGLGPEPPCQACQRGIDREFFLLLFLAGNEYRLNSARSALIKPNDFGERRHFA